MKWVRDATGRLPERPHYAPEELDRECEALLHAALRTRPSFPLSTDALTVLLEAHTSDLDLYADLSAEGPGVEGVTEFVKDGKPRVRISTALSDSPAKVHRLRTTLAHELGHVRFHAFLWKGAGLHGVRCLRDSIARPRGADWLEWQAGYVSGAILMPLTALRRAAQDAIGSRPTPLYSRSNTARTLVRHVSRTFDVSEPAARVRLTHTGCLTDEVPAELRRRFVPTNRSAALAR